MLFCVGKDLEFAFCAKGSLIPPEGLLHPVAVGVRGDELRLFDATVAAHFRRPNMLRW